MNRLPVVWVRNPDSDENEIEADEDYIIFRIADDWVAVDSDQLILPITLLERNANEVGDEKALLKQYGGESLLNDMLMSHADVKQGTEWLLTFDVSTGRSIEPFDQPDSD